MTAVRSTRRDILVGLIGRGIAASRTPSMHIAEGKAQGLHLDYRIIDMDAADRCHLTLKEILEQVEREGYRGVNITHPFKVEVIPLLDELSVNANAVSAVNTVVFDNGVRRGHNTDLRGFTESFRREFGSRPHQHVLLVGAGGAGAAVAHALVDCGVRKLSLYDIDRGHAESLADHLAGKAAGVSVNAVADLAAVIAEDRPDGLVNATPMGMANRPGSAVPPSLLAPQIWVIDIVYFPLETELLRAARAHGCHAVNGEGMAIFQAVRAFELFTGLPADPDRMRATFESFGRPTPDTPGAGVLNGDDLEIQDRRRRQDSLGLSNRG